MRTIKAVRVQGMSYPKVLRPHSSSSRLDFPRRAVDGLPNIGGPKEKMANNQIPDDPELVSGAVKPTSRFGTRPTKTDHAEGVTELAADPIVVPKPPIVEDANDGKVDPQKQPEQQPAPEPVQVPIRNAWEPGSPGETPLRQVLAASGGRYVWMYLDSFEMIFFVESQECIRYNLLPPDEKRQDGEVEVRTLVSKQWVLPEVIDSFNKTFEEHDEAFYSIMGKLSLVSQSLWSPLGDLCLGVLTYFVFSASSNNFTTSQPTSWKQKFAQDHARL
jgi:hypothetical protein